MSEADVTGPADLPAHVRAYLAHVTDVYRAHDVDAIIREVMTPDVEVIDHRPLGGEPIVGLEAARSWAETSFEFIPDFEVRVDVLAHDGGDRYLARDTYSGQGTDVFGPAETEWYVVDQLRDGRLFREDIFGDEAAARAAFERMRAIS